MVKHFFRIWAAKWPFRKKNRKTNTGLAVPTPGFDGQTAHAFSAATYQNPCIYQMETIVAYIAQRRQIPLKKLELVLIDADTDSNATDDSDIEEVLSQLISRLNYLLLITDRPGHYETFADLAYEENGLIVQQARKSDYDYNRGNFIIDFQRCCGISTEAMLHSQAVYLPVYKKPWEINDNLDIMVPVGYNTLVVASTLLQ